MDDVKRKFPDLHVHTGEGSLRDTGSMCAELVKRASELGATAMAVTDHGTMVAIQNFRVACEEAGIKPIYGCEFYVDVGDGARTHFIVLAKNFDGYQAISKVCSETAYNIHSDRPIATLDMFERWFKDGIGKNNVIATSACMQGPLCRIILQNSIYDNEIEKIKKKMLKETKPTSVAYTEAMEKLQILQNELDKVKREKDEVFAMAKKTYKKELNKAIRLDDPELIAQAEDLRDKIEAAIKAKPKMKAEEEKASANLKEYKATIAPIVKSVEKYNKYAENINNLEASKVSERKAYNEAKTMLGQLLDIFGKDNFYVELQNHGIKEEIYAMPIIAKLASACGVPVVATNDVHYAIRDEAETRQYNFVQYKNYGWKDMEPQDWELYIKTDEEMAEWLGKILPRKVVKEAIENAYKIADICSVVEFEKDPKHYPKFPCKEGAKLHLRSLINRGKKKVKNWNTEYQKRVQYELKVIETMGFSDYLCIVEDFLNYARLVGKIDLDNPEFLEDPYNMTKLRRLAEGRVGEGCGPGRGSAAGSLICYLVGITNIDPVENGLLFERFLNPERVSMPDIDSDIAPKVRPYVIGYIKNRYGEKSVCQIMTISYFGAKSAIQAGARVLGKRVGDDKAFVGLSLELSKSIEDSKSSIEDIEEELLSINDSPEAKEIISIAKRLSGLPSGYGTHAGGIIISDNGDVSDYTPLMNVSGAIDCQLDLNWVEPMGMLKLDLLGLRNLGIITDCERAVQKEYGINLSIDSLPVEPVIFDEIFAKGNTNGVFQFESDGMKNTLTNFGPESMADLTLLNAVFRPGPLQYIDDITAVKKGKAVPKYIIPEMETILGDTYGKPVYQEQIMMIFNQFAGFSLGKADTVRRYMSKKKTDKFAAYKDDFIEGLVAHGANRKDAMAFWDELLSFSQYAFNKSHARAYCEVAYATAYLKHMYPEAYACGLLNYTASDAMAKTVLDTKNQNVSLKCPDVNFSDIDFSLHGSDVIYGLRQIPQVSASAKNIIEEKKAHGKYTSFKDFLMRVMPKRNVATNLIKSGALDHFGKRADLLAALPELLDILADLKKKKAIVETDTDNGKVERAKKSCAKFLNEFNELEIEPVPYDKLQQLNDEKELLGYYVSAHPMDGVKTKDFLVSLEPGNQTDVIAFASDFNHIVTKSGKDMLKFVMSDTTDVIDAIVFPDTYDKYADMLTKDQAYKFDGYLQAEGDEGTRVQFIVNKITKYIFDEEPIVINVPRGANVKKSLSPWREPYESGGKPVSVRYSNGKVDRVPDMFVSPDIKENEICWVY